MKLIKIALISLIFAFMLQGAGCADKMLPCKTPDVPQAKKGKDVLEYTHNVFIELELLREANKVCK